MTKRVLVISCMLLLSGKIQAQSAEKAELRTTNFSRADTVQAVQRIFSKHRAGGWIWTTAGAILAGRVASAAISNSSDPLPTPASQTITGLVVGGGVPAGIGISKLVRFSNAKEEQVLSLYQNTGVLPRYISKRLKTKHFKS
ncbi:hypothetical protein MUN82_14565 [Hymenobacter aerilatus]|uniref:Uncharacterized protein n=1 Tax=Hymenobacter aerilatus TaxID=2932251 RepID=A0A8T9ST11_9BACT|nr:hypothetical protein [Hymenobacter aerilatus]UOR04164.1 hypothetical protein MUN82_14565 [Hymenobacter aerilatus]